MNRAWLMLPALGLSGCALVALASQKKGFPEHAGAVRAPGLSAQATIHRDAYGIPHIRAATDADAAYALGYAHAQDRLFQADMNRRLMFGGLSPWLGERTIAFDAFMQSMQLRTKAVAAVERLRPQTRANLDAYAAGINAGAADLPALPVEYRVLGVEFKPWAASDSYGIVYLMAWGLQSNLADELFALSVRDRVGRQDFDKLVGADEGPPVDLFWNELQRVQLADWTPGFASFNRVLGFPDAAASNNWVVSGSRSADGLPIVANDPHLQQRAPSIWYPAEVQGDATHVGGMTFPGAPAVVIGHTQTLAWGFTNVMADAVDLAILPRQGDSGYIHAGNNRAFTTRTVTVHPKGGDPVQVDVLWTEVGPVITDADATHVAALRWSALEIEDSTMELFHDLNRAATVEQGMAVADWPAVASQNLVMGDSEGHIGWVPFGSFVRRKGHTGRIPYPAWTGDYGWQGWLDRRPSELDPERGYIVTANNRYDVDWADAITTRFAMPYRRDRIAEVIESKPKHDWASMAALQHDHLDIQARERIPQRLQGVTPSTPAAVQCHALLSDWDFVASPDSQGAAVWAALQQELVFQVLQPRLGEEGVKRYLAATPAGRTIVDGELEHFSDDVPRDVDTALDRACTWLTAELGPDPALWTWGALHPLHLMHPFGGKLDSWNQPQVGWFGTPNTVNAGSYRLGERERMATTSIASMRLVMPLSDLSNSTLSHPGGSSGHPKHPDFGTLFEAHRTGKQVPLWWGQQAVDKAAQVLVLEP